MADPRPQSFKEAVTQKVKFTMSYRDMPKESFVKAKQQALGLKNEVNVEVQKTEVLQMAN